MLAASELRELLKRGNYVEALQHTDQVRTLLTFVKQALEKQERTRLKTRSTLPLTSDFLDAAALLAELYDQTSNYKAAAGILAADPDGTKTLERLEQAGVTEQRKRLRAADPESRKLYRACAMFCMAHAISLHRLYLKRPEALSQAITIAEAVLVCLDVFERAGYHLSGAQSFAHYWLGRFQMLHYELEEAEQHFEEAIQHQHRNVSYHLDGHLSRSEDHSSGSARDCGSCRSVIFLSSYHIASTMAFGLATIRLQTGAISEALTILGPAQVLLEGSTDDRYRQGYVRLLVGNAMRIKAGMDVGLQREAETQLLGAVSYFEETQPAVASHSYYAARAYYQLSLTQLFVARSGAATFDSKCAAIVKLANYFSRTSYHHGRCEDQYADREVKVGLPVLRARTVAEIFKVLSGCSPEDFNEAISRFVKAGNMNTLCASISNADATAVRLEDELGRRLIAEAESNVHDAKELCGLKDEDDAKDQEAKELERAGNPRTRDEVHLAEADVAATLYEVVFAGLPEDSAGTARKIREAAHEKIFHALRRVNKLTSPQVSYEKLRGSAHVLAARLLLLMKDVAGARRHLISGWEPLAGNIENQVVNDAAREVLKQITGEGYVLLATRNDSRPLTMDEMSEALHRKLIEEGRAAGLSLEEIAKALGRSPRRLNSWKNGKKRSVKERAGAR